MSASALEQKITKHSLDTGIPRKELRRMCMQAGLEQLERGELKVSAKSQTTDKKGGHH